jgi:hypothetical protein
LARLLRERRRFVIVTTVATGLSLIPAIAAPDDTATRAVLVGNHLLAAAIIIPTLSQRLTAVNNDRRQGAEDRDREAAECPPSLSAPSGAPIPDVPTGHAPVSAGST